MAHNNIFFLPQVQQKEIFRQKNNSLISDIVFTENSTLLSLKNYLLLPRLGKINQYCTFFYHTAVEYCNATKSARQSTQFRFWREQLLKFKIKSHFTTQ